MGVTELTLGCCDVLGCFARTSDALGEKKTSLECLCLWNPASFRADVVVEDDLSSGAQIAQIPSGTCSAPPVSSSSLSFLLAIFDCTFSGCEWFQFKISVYRAITRRILPEEHLQGGECTTRSASVFPPTIFLPIFLAWRMPRWEKRHSNDHKRKSISWIPSRWNPKASHRY